MEKCSQLTFQGVSNQMKLFGWELDSKQAIKELGVTVQKILSWRLHVDTIICKANQVLYMLRRNVHAKVRRSVKLSLYKSLVLPFLLYGFNCVLQSQRDLNQLERFQRKVLKLSPGREN